MLHASQPFDLSLAVFTNHALKFAVQRGLTVSPQEIRPIFLSLGDSAFADLPSHHYLIFPVTAVIVARYVWLQSPAEQLAVIGFDGMYGKAQDVFRYPFPVTYSVLQPGHALALPIRFVQQNHDLFRNLLMEQQAATLKNVALALRCTVRHSATQRVASWLVAVSSRSPLRDIHVSHSKLAALLGFRREAITYAISRLRKSGAVSCVRSKVSIKDFELLTKLACDCRAF